MQRPEYGAQVHVPEMNDPTETYQLSLADRQEIDRDTDGFLAMLETDRSALRKLFDSVDEEEEE